MVDKQAKTSLSLESTSFEIPFSNFKPSINKYILEEWQTSWNNSIGNKLLDIKPTIGEYQSVVRNMRREEAVFARLCLGHTRVTHSYSLESPYHLVAVSGAHFTQGTILIVILVSSGSAKSRTHQSAVGGFLVTRRGWPGRLRACRIWTFINSV